MAIKTWFEIIMRDFPNDEYIQEELFKWMTKTIFKKDNLPPGFEFLGGFVNLRFEDLGLSDSEHRNLLLSFGKTGVVVPGTNYRLRNQYGMFSVIEPVDGTEEATLPINWKEVVYVTDKSDKLTYIGKKVGPEQIGKVDMTNYKDIGYGWMLS